MDGPRHLAHLDPCPFLPVPERPLGSESVSCFGDERGPDFYVAALEYAQSLWLQGFPAKSLLLINRALGADIAPGDPLLRRWPLPYRAAAWVMMRRGDEQFIGNPRRHYQHLATRMVEPRRELRSWRAWGCWLIATAVYPDFPVDELQIEREGLVLPDAVSVLRALDTHGLPGEVGQLLEAISLAARGVPRPF